METKRLVMDLLRAAKNERNQHKRHLMQEAAEKIWNSGDDLERVPLPCTKCGSTSTDCGCD